MAVSDYKYKVAITYDSPPYGLYTVYVETVYGTEEVELLAGWIVLLTSQDPGAEEENGLWITVDGDAWVRPSWADEWSELVGQYIQDESLAAPYYFQNEDGGTVGVTPQYWTMEEPPPPPPTPPTPPTPPVYEYGVKYSGGWTSARGVRGMVYIDQAGYSGAITDITLRGSGLRVSYVEAKTGERIIGLTAEFAVLNDLPDYFTLLELLDSTEMEYRVRITIEYPSARASLLFEGFLNHEASSIKYLQRATLSLVASSFISRAENNYPDLIDDLGWSSYFFDTAEAPSFITLLQACLARVGSYAPVRVNCRLYAQGTTPGDGDSVLNLHGVINECWWEDNVARKTGKQIINAILTAFNAVMYWWDGCWYVERWEDAWRATIDYAHYEADTEYDAVTPGTKVTVSKTTGVLKNLIPTEQSMTIRYVSGVQKQVVELEDKLILNYVVNDFSQGSTDQSEAYTANYRAWRFLETPPETPPEVKYENLGVVAGAISNSVRRWHQALGSLQTTADVKTYRGIMTRVRVTIAANTTINLSWKYATSKIYLQAPYPDTSKLWEKYTFRFHWWLRDFSTGLGIVWNSTEERYELGASTDPSVFVQMVEVPGSSFDNPDGLVEVKISIPCRWMATNGYAGHKDLTMCIGQELVVPEGIDEDRIRPAQYGWFGDVILTATGEAQENYYEAFGDSAYTRKEIEKMDVFDAQSTAYKNGIRMSEYMTSFTEQWTTDGSTFRPLADWLLIGLFRNRFKNRQIIKADVLTVDGLQILQQFQDDRQVVNPSSPSPYDKMFLIQAMDYEVLEDTYRITLVEYDNVTVINI